MNNPMWMREKKIRLCENTSKTHLAHILELNTIHLTKKKNFLLFEYFVRASAELRMSNFAFLHRNMDSCQFQRQIVFYGAVVYTETTAESSRRVDRDSLGYVICMCVFSVHIRPKQANVKHNELRFRKCQWWCVVLHRTSISDFHFYIYSLCHFCSSTELNVLFVAF